MLRLVGECVDESQRLDYKRELKLDTVSDRKEAAKDASGMANGGGGVLIYGIGEEELPDGRRVPARPQPLTDGGLQARLEDVLTSSIRPPLMCATRLVGTNGGYFLVVVLQPRSRRVHMVAAYGDKRHYIRDGLKTRPMEQAEVDLRTANRRTRPTAYAEA